MPKGHRFVKEPTPFGRKDSREQPKPQSPGAKCLGALLELRNRIRGEVVNPLDATLTGLGVMLSSGGSRFTPPRVTEAAMSDADRTARDLEETLSYWNNLRRQA